ncbi:alpha/beta hydrolase [Corallincola luteus]|uniref:Alpha/beta hydrolase n=1 Tax=Corallincola luteus TaxID=1775177 RepID=A0ABY2AJM3_9GAMM|nr:alpha/beta family hydrolase [Corallincola luteus]TCI02985.1 alpha/beta hydrolase [Corallincola luteus]
MSEPLPIQLISQADKPIARMIMAHGAGAGMNSEFMAQMASLVTAQGIEVIRFNFPYMVKMIDEQRRRPPDRMPILIAAFNQVMQQFDDELPLFLAGKSMGSRVAANVAAETETALGVVAFGYPFHPPGQPDKLRLAELHSCQVPTLILQGQRDPFGKEDEWPGFKLPNDVSITAVIDGEHSFIPRKRSGTTLAENMIFAASQVAKFVNQQVTVVGDKR